MGKDKTKDIQKNISDINDQTMVNTKSEIDVLTGLYSRTKLEQMLETKYRNVNFCGVLFLDFNDFRTINEKYGVEAGDTALCLVAESIKKLQTQNIMSYRYNGDKLLVIDSDCSKDELRKLIDKWLKIWHELYSHSEIKYSMAVGMAWDSSPVSVEELIAKAHAEMYQNKELMKAGIPLEFCIQGEISCSYGLYSRKQFFDMVDYRLKNSSGDYCLLASDIEHFKLFNKWYGRKTGDEFLEEFAKVLKKYEKEYDGIASYFGGDNFTMLLQYNETVLNQLIEDLNKIALYYGNTVGFLPCFGVYKIEDKNLRAVELYDHAVEALTYNSDHIENRIHYYDKELTNKEEDELHLLTEVRKAIAEGQMTIYLQPKCQIKSRKIVGAEALVRWIHPIKGMISPGVFIPVLEKNGFINVLDRYVWELVCQQIRKWIDKGITPVPVSINVSRIDILSMDVVETIEELVRKYDIDQQYIKIEITESAYVENDEKIVETVKDLREHGFTLMMDDFGSGYSSLNMLRQILVDIIKIDMKFLDFDHDDIKKGLGILKSVVNMSKEIEVAIVVEGVETEEQYNFLGKMGVRFAQGYLFYRPMPIDDFTSLISIEENIDRRGIYQRGVDTQYIEEMIEIMLAERQKRYNQVDIRKIRGGFISYKADESEELMVISKSVVSMFGCETEEEFRKYVGNSFKGMVHPEDREYVKNEIDEQIFDTQWKMDYIEYRIITQSGQIRYINDYGHLEENPDTGEAYFYVFLLDVTDRIV